MPALRVPAAEGVNVTAMLQLPLGGRELGQLLFSAKSPLSVPVIWIDAMVKSRFPVFSNVAFSGLLAMLIGWLPKLTLGGANAPNDDRLTSNTVPQPV
jgi:hypothetical protein